MRLRILVIALLVANLLLAAWHGGWFDFAVGYESRTEREPARVTQQVRPQSVKVFLPGADTLRGPPPVPSAPKGGEPTPKVEAPQPKSDAGEPTPKVGEAAPSNAVPITSEALPKTPDALPATSEATEAPPPSAAT